MKVYNPPVKRKYNELKGIAKRLQDKTSSNSEYIQAIYGDASGVCDDLNANTIKEGQLEWARKHVYDITQKSLKERGFPEEFYVYRGGFMPKGDDSLVPVTTAKWIANRPYFVNHGGLYLYKVKRKDVLVDVDAIEHPLKGGDEKELLVMRKNLEHVSGSGRTTEGAWAKISKSIPKTGKYYRASAAYLGDKAVIEPLGYYEAVDKNGDPIMDFGEHAVSDIPETAASKHKQGAILGAYSMLRFHNVGNDKVYLYEINVQPDVDLSHWSHQDFSHLDEVRYRKPVTAKYVGAYAYTKKDRDKFNSLYALLSEDYPPSIHDERMLQRKVKNLEQYLAIDVPKRIVSGKIPIEAKLLVAHSRAGMPKRKEKAISVGKVR